MRYFLLGQFDRAAFLPLRPWKVNNIFLVSIQSCACGIFPQQVLDVPICAAFRGSGIR